MSRLLLVPLDDLVVFPGMTLTLAIDAGEEDRVLLVPRHENEFAAVGTIAEINDRARLPGGSRAVSLQGLHRGVAGASDGRHRRAPLRRSRGAGSASDRPRRTELADVYADYFGGTRRAHRVDFGDLRGVDADGLTDRESSGRRDALQSDDLAESGGGREQHAGYGHAHRPGRDGRRPRGFREQFDSHGGGVAELRDHSARSEFGGLDDYDQPLSGRGHVHRNSRRRK